MGRYSQILQSNGGKYSKLLKSAPVSAQEETVADPMLLERNREQVEEQVSSQRKVAIPDAIYKGIEDLASIYSAPTTYINKGIEQLKDNPIAGAINIGQGVAHGAFSLTGFPQVLSVVSTANKAIFGEKAGKAFDDIMNLPAITVQEGTKQLDKAFGNKDVQSKIFRGVVSNLVATGRPEMQVLTPFLSMDNQKLDEISEGLNEVNQLAATLLGFKALHEVMPEKVTPIKVTEEVKPVDTNALEMLDKQTKLQVLYNERNARLAQRDKLTGSNQKFMDNLISKYDEQITPLENELGIKASKIEQTKPVEGLTQELLPTEILKQTELKVPPTQREMVSLRPEVTSRLDKPSFEQEIKGATQADLEKANLQENQGTVTPQNSLKIQLDKQGETKGIEPIESIGSKEAEPLIVPSKSVFGEEKLTVNNLNSANDAIKFAQENKGNPDVLNQLETTFAETQTKAKEALANDSPDAELLQGKASILNDAINEMKKGEPNEQVQTEGWKEEVKPAEDIKSTDTTPEETTFGATLLPADFSLKNMKQNFNENTETVKNVLSEGAKLAYEGITDFKNWSVEMTKLYGNAIQPHLQRVWLQTQGLAKDDRNKFGQDLLKYAEEKGILPDKFTRAGRELAIENATTNIKNMIKEGASQEDFNKVVRQSMSDSPEQQMRFEELRSKKLQENRTGKQILNTDEVIEYENLRKQVRGELKSRVVNNFRIPFQVVDEIPTLKAIYQTEFESARTAEIEKIKLTNDFTTLVQEARKSTGSRYDENVIKALSGEKISLTSSEQKLVDVLKDFTKEAEKFKEKIMTNYDLPHKPRGVVEAYRKSGLLSALKEKMKKTDPREVNTMVKNFGTNKMFDPYSMTRFGRTEHPTMDIMQRLEGYINIFTLQKNLEPIIPTIRRLEQAMDNAGLINNTTWSKNYLKELFGENFNTGMQGKEGFKKAMRVLDNTASVRHLAYNPTGGLGNLIGGILQNITSPDISLKQIATGTKRLVSEQGFDILTERGIVDAPLLDKTLDLKDVKQSGSAIAKALVSPYQFYSAGEQVIQGMFYLGKLTPEEFRTKIIEASRDRQILEGKAAVQGGYHRGLRPSIVRTTLGKSAMKFRLWVPAVMESKVQKIVAVGRLAESIWKGRNNITMKDKANLRASLKEITALGSAVLLLNELPDDTKKSLSDALSNAYGYLKGDYWWRQTQNVIPSAQTISELALALGEASSGSVYEQDSEYGKEGTSKALGTLKRMTPTFAKSLVKEDIPEEIKNIQELTVKVNEARKKALESKSAEDIIQYKLYDRELDRAKARSAEYRKLERERFKKSIMNKRTLKISE